MTITEERIGEELRKHGMSGQVKEWLKYARTVCDVLADIMEQDEPHATITIEHLRESSSNIDDTLGELE